MVEVWEKSRFKFKGDRYLELHKLISGLSFKNILIAVQTGTIGYIYEQLPDEFMGDVDEWVRQIYSVVSNVQSKAQIMFEAAPKESRKEFAIWVKANGGELVPYLFAMFDNKNIIPMIYKMAF